MNACMQLGIDGNSQEFKELEFAVFCIENIAKHLGVDGTTAYDLLARRTDALQNYIIPCYDVLHTQGKDYIVEDIMMYLRNRGVGLWEPTQFCYKESMLAWLPY